MKSYKLKKDIFKEWDILIEEQVKALWIKEEYLEDIEINWASNGLGINNSKEINTDTVDICYWVDENNKSRVWNQYAITWLRFDTLDNAKKFAGKLEALRKIRKRKTYNDWEYVPNWKNSKEKKYYIYYAYSELIQKYNSICFGIQPESYLKGIIKCGFDAIWNHQAFLPYYSSEDIWDRAIKELGEEYLILLRD